MIDYLALALGHGLLAIAFLRLMMSDGLDEDPLIGGLKSETEGNRRDASGTGRNAARRANADADASGKAGSSPPADD